jgi:preprotein translocase subunit SecF
MRYVYGTLISAFVLMVGALTGTLSTWALAVGAVWVLVAAVFGAVALEGRDLSSAQGLLSSEH